MRTRTRITRSLTLLLALSAFAAAAKANVAVYTDGPTNGNYNAWTINNGFQVEDYFTLNSPSTLVGVSFGNWILTGDTAISVDWAIVGFEGGQVPICGACSGVAAGLTGTFDFTNVFGFDVYDEYFVLPNIPLAGGDYWLELQNETVSNGDVGAWDMNGGPTPIWDSAFGDQSGLNCTQGTGPGTCSDAFTIYAPSPTPEPGSLALLGSALTLLGAELRRRRIL